MTQIIIIINSNNNIIIITVIIFNIIIIVIIVIIINMLKAHACPFLSKPCAFVCEAPGVTPRHLDSQA